MGSRNGGGSLSDDEAPSPTASEMAFDLLPAAEKRKLLKARKKAGAAPAAAAATDADDDGAVRIGRRKRGVLDGAATPLPATAKRPAAPELLQTPGAENSPPRDEPDQPLSVRNSREPRSRGSVEEARRRQR